MTRFAFTAQTENVDVIKGYIDAPSKEAAAEIIFKQGNRPISISQTHERLDLLSFIQPKTKSTDLVIFTRQLSTMVSAGVPLLRALNTLTEQSESKALKSTLSSITKDIQSGMSLGEAFEKHPKTFSDVYVNMVKAGESGGILDGILKRLAIQQEKNDSMKKKVKSAMTYPIILLIITIGAFFGLMFFVVPTIGDILYDLGGPDAQLPLITQIMLSISGWMLHNWHIVIIATILFVVGIR